MNAIMYFFKQWSEITDDFQWKLLYVCISAHVFMWQMWNRHLINVVANMVRPILLSKDI